MSWEYEETERILIFLLFLLLPVYAHSEKYV